MRPDIVEDGEHITNCRQLVVVNPTCPDRKLFSRFQLPEGWIVEERPRSLSYPRFHVDKYYYEPGTGMKFRSLRSVERHITGEGNTMPRLREARHKKATQIVARSSDFSLPDDWVVEKIPRRNPKYPGVSDKYYIEPGTGMRFRSRVAVERYLKEMEENSAPLSTYIKSHKRLNSSKRSGSPTKTIGNHSLELALVKSSNHSKPSKRFGSQKENIFSKMAKTSVLASSSVPAKVNWILTTSVENTWTPVTDETIVTESEKKTWSKKFILAINGSISDVHV